MQLQEDGTSRDMGIDVARRMNALNARFYRENAASFSQTRRSGWPGWERCLAEFERGDGTAADSHSAVRDTACHVLDLACGNLRFARFLADAGLKSVFYLGMDDCPELAEGASPPDAWDVSLRRLDIVSALLAGGLREELCAATARAWGGATSGPTAADLAVAFGFLHHVPTHAARLALLRAMLAATRPGGTCCVSFWKFMSDERLAAKASATTREALAELGMPGDELGTGDYLLGWQDVPGAWRYCHSFDDAEVDGLLACLGGAARPVARFCSDGRSGDLNAYVVLRRL
ncbi:class I SAM-dependent methyltransferase [Parafannyhessea sp. LCP21S3_E6]|uniref:class I SAM-dependent methyltransferase n=1 Tax=Parafannyhessea sp. LCP21S3_E6 TaxID=3438796 RepID=UPI003F9939D5